MGIEIGRPFIPSLVCYCYALSQMFERARIDNFVSGFLAGGSAWKFLEISHLLFAESTLIFSGADLEQIWHLKLVFVSFRLF